MTEEIEDIVELSKCPKCGESIYVATEQTNKRIIRAKETNNVVELLATDYPLATCLLGPYLYDTVKHRCNLIKEE
mgnify:CR=1 FL=1